MSHSRIAILISGRGSNLASLMEAADAPGFPGEVVLVLSNRPDAPGLSLAREAGIEALALDHEAFDDRAAFDRAVHEALTARGIDLVCLAGFMRVLTSAFVEAWAGRMLNVHPSLLPLFRGTGTHRRAIEAGVLIHGCTVHFVVPELDSGPIVAQAAIIVGPRDTPETLAARVLEQEHRLYPAAMRMVCEGTARLEDGRVVFGRAWETGGALRAPS